MRAGLASAVRAHLGPISPCHALAKPRFNETHVLLGAPGSAASHDESHHSENEPNHVTMDLEDPAFGDVSEPDILRSYFIASSSTDACLLLNYLRRIRRGTHRGTCASQETDPQTFRCC